MTGIDWFDYLTIAWISLAIISFPFLFKITAPFGRHTNKKFGPLISNKWGWVIMESPAILFFGFLILAGTQTKSTATWIIFGAWMFHYINRTLIYPFRTKTQGKQIPLLIVGSAIFFQLTNGFLNGFYIGTAGPAYDITWLADPRFLIGACVFISGTIINWQADQILLNLRKPGETGYKIPRGGLYRWISCPNFFGEIIEWIGFAIMCWSLPGLSFALWTIVNLTPRAIAHHKWYLEKFPDYPKERKALIPFLV